MIDSQGMIGRSEQDTRLVLGEPWGALALVILISGALAAAASRRSASAFPTAG